MCVCVYGVCKYADRHQLQFASLIEGSSERRLFAKTSFGKNRGKSRRREKVPIKEKERFSFLIYKDYFSIIIAEPLSCVFRFFDGLSESHTQKKTSLIIEGIIMPFLFAKISCHKKIFFGTYTHIFCIFTLFKTATVRKSL